MSVLAEEYKNLKITLIKDYYDNLKYAIIII